MTTMTMPGFNPLRFAARLKEAGVPDRQAEAEAEVLHEALAQQAQIVSALDSKVTALKDSAKRDAEQMATKGDIAAVKSDIDAVKEDVGLVKSDIALLDAKIALVRQEIAIARRDTIIWLGGMLVVGFSTVMVVLPRLMG